MTATSSMLWREKRRALLQLVDSAKSRQDIYRYLRKLKVYKGVSALCSATQSEYLKRANIVRCHYAWTADLIQALRSEGWLTSTDSSGLRGLDECFSRDTNRNGAPDHVYMFLYWLDRKKLMAMVLDNYSPDPHPRNIGPPVWYRGKYYARTRYHFSLRMPS